VTRSTSFIVAYGVHPRHPAISKLVKLQCNGVTQSNPGQRHTTQHAQKAITHTLCTVPKVQASIKFTKAMHQATGHTRLLLHAAIHMMMDHVNKKRTTVTPYKVGGRVWLSSKFSKLEHEGCDKFMPRYCGPFTIVKQINPVALELELPRCMNIHPFFHASFLKPSMHCAGAEVRPRPIIISGYEEFASVKLLRSARRLYAYAGPVTSTCRAFRSLDCDSVEPLRGCYHQNMWVCAFAGPCTRRSNAIRSLECDLVKPLWGCYHQNMRVSVFAGPSNSNRCAIRNLECDSTKPLWGCYHQKLRVAAFAVPSTSSRGAIRSLDFDSVKPLRGYHHQNLRASAFAGPSTSTCIAICSFECDSVEPLRGCYHQDMWARAPRSAPVLLPEYRALHAPKPWRMPISTPRGHQMLVLALLSLMAIRARAGCGLNTTTSTSSIATPTINGALPRPSSSPLDENWALMTVIELFQNITTVVTRDKSDSTTSSNNKQRATTVIFLALVVLQERRLYSRTLWFGLCGPRMAHDASSTLYRPP
jgi:hypothetical protein